MSFQTRLQSFRFEIFISKKLGIFGGKSLYDLNISIMCVFLCFSFEATQHTEPKNQFISCITSLPRYISLHLPACSKPEMLYHCTEGRLPKRTLGNSKGWHFAEFKDSPGFCTEKVLRLQLIHEMLSINQMLAYQLLLFHCLKQLLPKNTSWKIWVLSSGSTINFQKDTSIQRRILCGCETSTPPPPVLWVNLRLWPRQLEWLRTSPRQVPVMLARAAMPAVQCRGTPGQIERAMPSSHGGKVTPCCKRKSSRSWRNPLSRVLSENDFNLHSSWFLVVSWLLFIEHLKILCCVSILEVQVLRKHRPD